MKSNIIKQSVFFGVGFFLIFALSLRFFNSGDYSWTDSFIVSAMVAIPSAITWGIVTYYWMKKKQHA